MNSMIGQKLSITAHKPQTTRHVILGIHSTSNEQLIYVDTPGIHLRKSSALNRVLNRSASAALRDVDVIVLVVQACRWTDEDTLAFDTVCRAEQPFIIAVNKIDLITDKEQLLPYLAKLPSHDRLLDVVCISARTGDKLVQFQQLLANIIPEGEFVYSADEITDASERFLASEIVREQLTRQLDEELPYALTVEIESLLVEQAMYRINAIIWVNRESQKAIVIGKKGSRLKSVGTRARLAMQHLFNRKVHLELWVKVKENWADDARALRSLGYDIHK